MSETNNNNGGAGGGSTETPIDMTELGRHLRRAREAAHLSLREVARQTMVSASTLSRVENGLGVPDTPTLARIALWLNFPIERIVKPGARAGEPVVYYPDQSIPDILEAHLRADPNLSNDAAQSLAELFRVAYSAYHRMSRP